MTSPENVVKDSGVRIPFPAAWLERPCWRCGADDAETKRIDFLAAAWECGRHYDNDLKAAGAHLVALFDAALAPESPIARKP